MAHAVTHSFVSPIVDDLDPNIAGPDEWNANHVVTIDASLIDHGGLSGLGDNDHPQYLLTSVVSGLANPTASVGLTAVNGSATTAMRSDAAPPLSQAIIPNWTGTHTFSAHPVALAVSGADTQTGATSTFTISVQPSYAPSSGTLTNAISLFVNPSVLPATGTTISNIFGMFMQLNYGSAGGSVTASIHIYLQRSYGTTKPGTAYGIFIENLGAAGITTSYGLYVAAQSGSTTNIAILTLGGEHRLVGNVKIGANSTPATELDVAGVITVTTGIRQGTLTAGRYLRSDGTNFVSNTIQSGDLPGSFSGFANPSATIGLTAVNGSATTAMRSDGAPALSQAIVPTWTGTHTWNGSTMNMSTTFTGDARSVFNGATWTSSSNHTLATGFDAILQIQPAAGVTISAVAPYEAATVITGGAGSVVTTSYGLLTTLILNTASGTTVGTHYGVRVDFAKVSGSVTTNFGLYVVNMGHSGGTTAYGLYIESQTGSTTNWAAYFAGGAVRIITRLDLGSPSQTTAPLNIAGAGQTEKIHFDNADRNTIGTYQTSIQVSVGGTTYYMPCYS